LWKFALKVRFVLNNLSTIGKQRYFTGYINDSFPLHGRFYVFREIWKLKRKVYENLKKGALAKIAEKFAPAYDLMNIVLTDHDLLT